MISTTNLNLSFGGRRLFENVNVRFVAGNCYGLIGANGSGKSTFLKILSGLMTPSSGTVDITPLDRISYLRQDQFEFDGCQVLKTVIQGHSQLSAFIEERETLYAKSDFSDADGDRAAELELAFGDLDGWEAESNAAILLSGLGIDPALHTQKMSSLNGSDKLKVLLAQALFGKPDILLLDEPTNHLDTAAIAWLEEFLYGFEQTVIVVSHDRHFLNKVCTHMADIDFSRIQLYSGNYDFWYESSQLAIRMAQEKNRKMEDKAKELKEFIARFSANASKSKQATSRKKQLEKLTLDDIKPSSRQYPFVGFKPDREAGDQLLRVVDLCRVVDGKEILSNVTFTVNTAEKIVFVGDEIAITVLFRILMGEEKQDRGEFGWGITTSQAYFPKDGAKYFEGCDLNLIDWLRQFSSEKSETFIRGFLGRMLFSGSESLKKVSVLSGGERVRCLLARMMLTNANVLILDGPTNHLDLESITAVNNGLMRFPGTVLFASHDHQLNQTIHNRVIEISAVGATTHDMSYDEYLKR